MLINDIRLLEHSLNRDRNLPVVGTTRSASIEEYLVISKCIILFSTQHHHNICRGHIVHV